ncbi:DUF2461 domain-containing protein [Fulvivirga lutimaris]|uniref:DUF2461 domain-containing protein n=1 Tax=Fulvivirga lutimaris TaxID=1819566 RepID=UPI0012BB5366|nr:DUF2461 domain-containing protein [Fulvivirga lutimaris]MTI38828.1 DUF2461 domain-containing protein [Fulvivirga lutimaris]
MITKEYISFFKGLEKDNNKEWFHANKSTYETHVKAPFIALMDDLINEIQEFDSDISMNAKDSIFRINKDVRFSKDKTPYNTLMKAGVSPGGKRSELPGYYLGISADTIHMGGGLFNLDTTNLKKVRTYIVDNAEEFKKLINDTTFVQHFESLKGDQAKRLDTQFKAVQAEVPDIANKQFYAMTELPLKDYVGSEKLKSVIMDRFKLISPMVRFLKKALQ